MKRALVILLAGLAGCSSFGTQPLDRMDNDTICVNPEKPLKGIPVSIPVPSHLELRIIETTFWEQKVNNGRPTLVPLRSCRPTRRVQHDVCRTEKVFLVDPRVIVNCCVL